MTSYIMVRDIMRPKLQEGSELTLAGRVIPVTKRRGTIENRIPGGGIQTWHTAATPLLKTLFEGLRDGSIRLCLYDSCHK